MSLKIFREELLTVSVEKLAIENCADIMKSNESLGRCELFKGKTCKRQFYSIQALAGHGNGHKNKTNKLESLPIKPKKHKCSLCGKEFDLGKALGGYMRKHRDELNQPEQKKQKLEENPKSGEFAEAHHDKKDLTSTKKNLFFDLNLTPNENELMRGNITF